MADEEVKKDGAAATPAPAADAPKAADPASLPKDALEKTNEELANDKVIDATNGAKKPEDAKPTKQPNAIKKILKKVDIYLVGVVLLVAIAGGFTAVSYLNSKKAPKTPTISSQQLTPNAIKSLATSNVSINNSAQTLTIQGNSIFTGQVLMRGNLVVAGNIQAGGSLSVPTLTVSNSENVASSQIDSLQVAKSLVVQGTTSLASLTVSAASTFSGPITASSITVTNLIISGTGGLQIPNHLSFTGPSPARAINSSALGAGGTASVNGSDTTGAVNVNTGNGPAAGCFITLTFAQHFATSPRVIISPIDAGASQSGYYAIPTTTTVQLCMSSPPSNQTFAFDYFITD